MREINKWQKHSNLKMKRALAELNEAEFKHAFSHELTFGTAGVRGKMGPGPAHFNEYTIIKYVYGYARYLISQNYERQDQIQILVATDSRRNNAEYLKLICQILSHFQLKVIHQLVLPTPVASFLIKRHNLDGAIVLTASHNNASDNGLKFYNHAGGQILNDASQAIVDLSLGTSDLFAFESDLKPAKPKYLKALPSEWINDYHQAIIESFDLTNKANLKFNKKLKVVFSPQNGTTGAIGKTLLETAGFEVLTLPGDLQPDGEFSQKTILNPEHPEVLAPYIELAKQKRADLVLVNDPDGDRLAIVCLDSKQAPCVLTGNEAALIALDSLLKEAKVQKPTEFKKMYVASSIVSTQLATKMLAAYQVEHLQVATGFKFISHLIKRHGPEFCLFAFEESQGYLFDATISAEKDGIQALVFFAKLAAKLKAKGQTLQEALVKINQKYGFSVTAVETLSLLNLDDKFALNDVTDYLRKSAKSLNGATTVDYLTHEDAFKQTNLICYQYPSKAWVGIRASGTEAKLKVYYEAIAKTKQDAELELQHMHEEVKTLLNLD